MFHFAYCSVHLCKVNDAIVIQSSLSFYSLPYKGVLAWLVSIVNCFLLVLSLFYSVAVCFPEIWTSSAISFKYRCHRTWHMMIFTVFSLFCSGTHDGQVKKMLQYTWFQRIYQWCVCWYCSLKSAMLKQCRLQQNPYWICWPVWMLISVIEFLLHSVALLFRCCWYFL